MFGFGSKTKTYQDIDAEKFQELMKEKETVVLDVRTPAETSDGVVPGYQMINIMAPDFREQINKLDKSKTYLVYCRSGNRSGQACDYMAGLGFDKLYNLSGGIGAWNRAFGKTAE